MLKLAGLDPRVEPYAAAAIAWANQYGVRVTITSVKRTRAEQQSLYNSYVQCLAKGPVGPGRSEPQCRYPANPPGKSLHEYGLAWDSVVPPEYQDWWDAVRKAYGWRIPANDRIHAEWQSWSS